MKAEVESVKEERKVAQEDAEKREKQLREEAEAKVSELKRLFTAANRYDLEWFLMEVSLLQVQHFSFRDKEAMVMKYAMGEKEVIVQRKGKEEAERKLAAVTRERDDVTFRAKVLAQEKAKAQQVADSRHQVSAQ